MRPVLALLADPPLDPSPDEAREALRRELLAPDYHDQDLVQRLLDRLQSVLDRTVEAAVATPPLQTLVAMVVAVGLAAALGWLLSRARRGATRRRAGAPGVHPAERVSAARLRARAEAALAEGRPSEAFVEGFRALARRQVERGRLADEPGTTAHEVATVLGAALPDRRRRVQATADRFDAVRYGDRVATAEQVREVLALDDDLRGAR